MGYIAIAKIGIRGGLEQGVLHGGTNLDALVLAIRLGQFSFGGLAV